MISSSFYRAIIILVLWLLNTCLSYGQRDSILLAKIDGYLMRTDKYYHINPDSVFKILDQAMKFSIRENNNLCKTKILASYAFYHSYRNEFKQAESYLFKADSLLSKEPDSKEKSILIQLLLNNKGFYYLNHHDFNKAESYYKDLLLKKNQKYNQYIRLATIRLSEIKFHQREYEQALSYCTKALNNIRILASDPSSLYHATFVYIHIGQCYMEQEKWLQARNALLKANAVFVDYNFTDSRDYRILNALCLSKCYIELSKPDSVKHFFKIAESLIQTKSSTDSYFAHHQSYLAEFYQSERHFDKAFEYYRKAYETYLSLSPNYTSPSPAKMLLKTAQLHAYLGQYSKAMQNLQAGLAACTPNFKYENNIFELPEHVDSIRFKYEALDLIVEKLKYIIVAWNKTHDLKYLWHAWLHFEYARRLSFHVIQSFEWEESKYAWSEKMARLYDYGLYCISEGWNIGHDEQLLSIAFNVIESFKYGVMLDEIKTAGHLSYAGIPTSITSLQSDWKTKLAFLQKQYYLEELKKEGKDTSKTNKLQIKILDLKKSLDSLETDLKKRYASYESSKTGEPSISLESFQNLYLDAESGAVLYFTGDKYLYSLVITHKKCEFIRKEVPAKELSELVKSVLKRDKFEVNLANKLYNLLLDKNLPIFHDKVNRLLICPDGPLHLLSFDMLVEDDFEGKNMKEYPYLINRFAIRYIHSISLWHELNQREKYRAENYWAGFAGKYNIIPDSNEAWMKQLVDLQGAEREITNCNKIMQGAAYYNTEVNRSNFINATNHYQIIHLALHAVLDQNEGQNSALVFTPQQDSNANYILTARELYQMPLKSDLVILTACNTGIGNTWRSEGAISLSRSLLYSGCKSTITTLWSLPDASPECIMSSFYNYIKQGHTIDKALQQAKLDYIKQQNNSIDANPIFWAGIVDNGCADTIQYKSRKKNLIITGFALFLLSLVWFKTKDFKLN